MDPEFAPEELSTATEAMVSLIVELAYDFVVGEQGALEHMIESLKEHVEPAELAELNNAVRAGLSCDEFRTLYEQAFGEMTREIAARWLVEERRKAAAERNDAT